MPLNEASGFRRSGLTREQKRQQEAAIYGLEGLPDMQNEHLTPAEIERMRAILAQHDQSAAGKGNNSFDLNKPPKQPYRHQEYPRVIYHKNGKHKAVKNATEFDAHLEDGWSDQPVGEVAQAAPALDAESAREAKAIDAQLKKARTAEAKKKSAEA
jgi:hypothetical protein